MPEVVAVSVWPTAAVPEIPGLPVAGVLAPVLPVPSTDHAPSPSALVARTCTL